MASSDQTPFITSAATARRAHAAGSLARGLGWFSIGLGLAEILAPRAVARAAGLRARDNTVRLYGLREIAAGVGILASRDPAPWLWARVGGDAIDLASVGIGIGRYNRRLGSAQAALAAVAGVAVIDGACARAIGESAARQRQAARDYRRRSGLPRSPDEMRGTVQSDERKKEDADG